MSIPMRPESSSTTTFEAASNDSRDRVLVVASALRDEIVGAANDVLAGLRQGAGKPSHEAPRAGA